MKQSLVREERRGFIRLNLNGCIAVEMVATTRDLVLVSQCHVRREKWGDSAALGNEYCALTGSLDLRSVSIVADLLNLKNLIRRELHTSFL